MKPLGIALLGCGVVGSGVAKLLIEQKERLTERAGRPLELRHVLINNKSKQRPAYVPTSTITDDVEKILTDADTHIVIELMGGLEPARGYILRTMRAGKDVVTANKAVLATHGDELFLAAHQLNRTITFEASVGGGIPIINAISQGLAANQIISIKAIVNGTTNYILTEMAERGLTYGAALKEAQEQGFAEADPTLDVSGMDSAHKLALLARLAFGVSISGEKIEREGIENVQSIDIQFAQSMGYVIKLLAEAWLSENRVALHVEPTLVHQHDPLALIRGPYNAIDVVGDVVKDTLFCGPGAGQMPTASAVVADVVDLAVGRAQMTFNSLKLWAPDRGIGLRSPSEIASRFYLRVNTHEAPGVVSQVTGVLGLENISLASVVLHEKHLSKTQSVPIVILTHPTNLGAVRRAIARLDSLHCSGGPTVFYPIAE